MRPVAKTLFVIFALLLGGCAGEGTRDSTQDEMPARGAASAGFVPRGCPAQSSKLVEIGKKLVRHGEQEFGSDQTGTAFYINRLAGLYLARGCYAEAEPLFKRALAIWEKSLGDDLLYEAMSLENYAGLLRETGRGAEAAKMEARAKAIRAKHAKENPAK